MRRRPRTVPPAEDGSLVAVNTTGSGEELPRTLRIYRAGLER